PESTKRGLGLNDVLPHELVKYSLNPLSSSTNALDNAFLVNPDPIHYNDHPSLIHHPDHSGEDPFKPLTKTLQIKRLLETRYLDNGVAVQEDLVNISRVRLRVREADAKCLSVNSGESADESLALRSQYAHVLLMTIEDR